MASHPLAEIFGFSYDDLSERAERYRNNKYCPFNNKISHCTKSSATVPLGVCSIFERGYPVITCPIRFREDWKIIDDAAEFFFGSSKNTTSLAEVRLNDANGKSAGDIDYVLISLDEDGNISDFGVLEVQAVYISGNVTKPFKYYIENRHHNYDFPWNENVRPDYLSSSRKRLTPQLIYKGRIIRDWGKKLAVAVQDSFFATMPELPVVPPEEAEVAWLIYKLERNATSKSFCLKKDKVIYTLFKPALDEITIPVAGDVKKFISSLQKKLQKKQKVYAPINKTVIDDSEED